MSFAKFYFLKVEINLFICLLNLRGSFCPFFADFQVISNIKHILSIFKHCHSFQGVKNLGTLILCQEVVLQFRFFILQQQVYSPI